MREILLGITASLFFAVTFILNRSMELSGGSWLWSASLRYIFMVPFLVVIVLARKNLRPLIQEMKKQPLPWLVWSFFGFVLFYAPITFAAAYGPGWLVAGTWQLTIVAGIFLGPLFYITVSTPNGLKKVRHRIPMRALVISIFILAGIVLIQWQNTVSVNSHMIWASVLPVAIAAVSYPLGNRKMMEVCGEKLDTFQRVLGMTLASLPFWLILAGIGFVEVGPPSKDQLLQSFVVALSSGVIATTLFFIATNRVRDHHGKLAAVEATQSAQVLFVVIGEMWWLSAPFPNQLATIGLAIVIAGMLLHSYFSKPRQKKKSHAT